MARHAPLPLLALLAVLAVLVGCPPTMVERDGRRVFNPFYAGFLDARSRDDWQQPERVLDALGLAPDAVVADIGAGSGYFTERLARRLAPGGGRVYATDVQPEMLERLRARVDAAGLDNVEVVGAPYDDPALPRRCCDLVLFSSVYKEIDGRVGYMEKVRGLLRPGGRVAILEFRPEYRGAGPPRAVRLPAEQITRELAAAGFALQEQHDFLPREYFLIFGEQDGHDATRPATAPAQAPAGRSARAVEV